MLYKKNIKQQKSSEPVEQYPETVLFQSDFLFEEMENQHTVEEWNSMGFQVISFPQNCEENRQQGNNF